jgi:hypothetical protein
MSAASANESGGPAGDENYVVERGDCISKIALDHGHFWKKLWNHPNNAELKQTRKNPNVLLAGDQVFIPALEPKEETCATEKSHKFVRKGEPSKIKLVLISGGEPRKDQDYVLDIDGKFKRGKTGSDGSVEFTIPGNARSGKITVGPDKEEFVLELGGMDPVEELSGVQARLNNLGYDCGGADGEMTPQTGASIRRFQKDNGLKETGEADDQTRAKLKEVHGC